MPVVTLTHSTRVCGCPEWWAQGKPTKLCQLPLPYLQNCARMVETTIQQLYAELPTTIKPIRQYMFEIGNQELKLNQLLAELNRRKR